MRTRIPISFTPNTRSITTGITNLTIDDIRLIVNETQKVVLCSSMQKNLVASVTNGVVTYVTSYQEVNEDGTTTTVTIPPIASGDKITFEVDLGTSNTTDQFVHITHLEIDAIVEALTSGDLTPNNNQ